MGPSRSTLNYPTMSAEHQQWNVDARGLKFAVVVARFNSAITEKLLAGAREALEQAGASNVAVFHVPGAFELPQAARRLAAAYDGIIALGAVIRGERRTSITSPRPPPRGCSMWRSKPERRWLSECSPPIRSPKPKPAPEARMATKATMRP
jgi:6,7-dimethyl-8-ribityllumazine synthase